MSTTTTARNEAAERLRDLAATPDYEWDDDDRQWMIDNHWPDFIEGHDWEVNWPALARSQYAALATERRLTVERIGPACRAVVGPWFDEGHEAGRLDPQELASRILDELAATPTEPER